jgi:ribonuclease R
MYYKKPSRSFWNHVPQKSRDTIGIYRQIKPDFGFVDAIWAEPTPVGEGLFVHVSKSLDALNGDTVAYKEIPGKFGKPEARILRVVKRGEGLHAGKIYKRGSYWFADLQSKELTVILNTKETFNDWVTAGIQVTGSMRETVGEVIEIIGNENESGYWKKLLFMENRVTSKFPDSVINQSKHCLPPDISEHFAPPISSEPKKDTTSKKEPNRRRDYREKTVFTIDWADAKDLDDAIQIEKNSSGYVLTVHIADVSEYVTRKSPLDIEARKRGTSIYLADEVIPMLPKNLSDGVCSLNTEWPKFCLAVRLEFDMTGKVIHTEVFESIIQSKYRGTYTEVQAQKEGKPHEIPDEIIESLKYAWELKAILDTKREFEGKIEFSWNEAKYIVENGKLVRIESYPYYESNELIEHFMVCANEEVSRFATAYWLAIPYRTHPIPTTSGLERLDTIVRSLGGNLHLKSREYPHPKEIQQAVNFVRSKDTGNIFSKGTISTMAKALYSPANIGHFWLAIAYYSHFTSPIRRYPDLVLHQAIKAHLKRNGKAEYIPAPSPDPWSKKGMPKNQPIITDSELDTICKSSTTNERRAEKMEYDYRDLLVCEWLQKDIGKSFTGTITSVMEKGYFIEILPFIEGFLPTGKMDKTIGENIKVTLISADMKTRKITLG